MTEDVRIERIAAGGDGVGRLADGRVAFVPRTAAGDLARVEVIRPEKRFVRGRATEIVEPGPGRTEPRCRHYQRDQCGGCQLQHLTAPAQVEARRAILADALGRIGKVAIDVPPVQLGEAEWGYRSKISLTVGRSGAIGYHRVGEPGSIFPLVRCEIAVDGVNALWSRVASARRLLPRHTARVVLRVDRTGGEHLVVETGPGPLWTNANALFEAIRAVTPLTIWWQPGEGAVRAVAGSKSAYPATAFEQVNLSMGDQIRRYAIGQLGPVQGRRVWDLYAGIGETSSLLALAGAAVVESVEWDRGTVEEAERRQTQWGRQIERVTGSVEKVILLLGKPDLVITNPPRTGMDVSVVEALRIRGPERIVYISCDPATLARDIGRFADPSRGGAVFTLVGVQGYDLFPQTAHLETVAVLERA